MLDDGEGNVNTVVIRGGRASVVDANCPDKLCEGMGSVSKAGETIVCLPHKLVVTVISAEEAEELLP